MTPEQIKTALESSGKTQVELARYMGWSESTVSRLLGGTRQIKASEIARLQGFVGGDQVSPDDRNAIAQALEDAIAERGIKLGAADKAALIARFLEKLRP
jgi:transcriptional regulator with XRE-family HTH domain